MSSGSEDKEPEMRHIVIVFQFREITPNYLCKKDRKSSRQKIVENISHIYLIYLVFQNLYFSLI